jgi:hypothetical protein
MSGSGFALASHVLAAQRAALLFRRATPDATVLVGHQGVLEAGPLHVARAADGLGGLDLLDRWTGGPNGEEQIGAL